MTDDISIEPGHIEEFVCGTTHLFMDYRHKACKFVYTNGLDRPWLPMNDLTRGDVISYGWKPVLDDEYAVTPGL